MNRRRWLTGAFATAATALLSACGQAGTSLAEQARRLGEGLTRRSQRLLIPRDALAPTYSCAEISPDFKANGSVDPAAADYKALKANHPDVPIVIITGYPDSEVLSRILAHGSVTVIQKPLEFEQLNRTVRQLGHKGAAVEA